MEHLKICIVELVVYFRKSKYMNQNMNKVDNNWWFLLLKDCKIVIFYATDLADTPTTRIRKTMMNGLYVEYTYSDPVISGWIVKK